MHAYFLACFALLQTARMRVRLEIQLAPPAIGYVRVQLGRGEIGMAEHLLHGAQVGASLEQVRGERVAQEVGMDALGLEPCLVGEAAQDEEDAGAGERPAVRVEEQLLPVAPVEVGPAAREVAAEGVRCLAPDRDDPFLAALAEAADEPVLEIHGLPVERDRLAHAQPGAVEELAEGAVAEVSRRRPGGRVEEPLDLGGRERARQRPAALRELDVRRRVVRARAPSSTSWRKKERTAASRRAIVVGARPSARSCAT